MAMRHWQRWAGSSAIFLLWVTTGGALADTTVDFYTKIHLSLDAASDGNTSQGGLSDNSSRFGFQGTHQVSPGLGLYWRLEQKVYMDESDGRFANPAYAGLEGEYGKFQAGFMDTPYKLLVSPFNIMDDTVADVRGILGYSALGADAGRNLNVRARNAIMVQKEVDRLSLSALYSFDYLAEGSSSGIDNNDYSGYSASLVYRDAKWLLGTAIEQWQDSEAIRGIRVGARYDFGPFNGGLIVEQTDAALTAAYRRQAMAIDIQYPFEERHTARLQLAMAGDYEGVADSGATQLALGDYYAASDALNFYLIYSRMENGENAKYRLGTSGHGDIIAPLYGADPWVLSLGLSYRLDYRFR
jgi:predicted porin